MNIHTGHLREQSEILLMLKDLKCLQHGNFLEINNMILHVHIVATWFWENMFVKDLLALYIQNFSGLCDLKHTYCSK